jgi:hypothetical protein
LQQFQLTFTAMTDAPRSVAIYLVLILCLASIALADDFKTIDGKEYKNATVKRVEPDGIVLTNISGISKVYFTELPKEVQQRFHYDAAQAAQFTAATQAAVSENNAAVANQQALAEQRRKVEIQQQQQAIEQQRQAAEQQARIEAQQEQRQLEAQQKQQAKIAAQKQARNARYSSARRASHARAIQEDINEQRRGAAENIRYEIEATEMALHWNPLSQSQRQEYESRLRELENQRASQLNSIHH